jgi:hypothetical protein
MNQESNNSSSMKLKKLKQVKEGTLARRDIYLTSYIRNWQLDYNGRSRLRFPFQNDSAPLSF